MKPRPLSQSLTPSNPGGEAAPFLEEGSTALCQVLEACELHYPEGSAPVPRRPWTNKGSVKRHFRARGLRLGGFSGVCRGRHFVNSDVFKGGELSNAGPARGQGVRKALCPLL